MAKEAPAKATNVKAKKSGGKFTFILLFILALLAMPFLFGSVILVLAGLIPTYIAFITDDDPEKAAATSVGAMNFAGIVPFLIDLWTKGQTPANAFHILRDPNSWLVILGASAIGQLIVYVVPQTIAALTQGHAEMRIRLLRKNLEMLKDSWGADVAAAKISEKEEHK